MFVLLGVALVVIGFALRINPLLVVTVSGIVTALIGGIGPLDILNAFGTGFAGSRSVTTFAIILPVIGLIERYGLQAQASRLISGLKGLTTGRILALYMVVRQVTAAIGLTTIGGPAQTVRPLVYPMAKAAEERRLGLDVPNQSLPEKTAEKIKAFSSSSDTVGLFFGEDVFVAVGSVLLITSFVDTNYGLSLEPLNIALWAIPVGIVAMLVHGSRLLMLDRTLKKMAGVVPATAATRAGGAL